MVAYLYRKHGLARASYQLFGQLHASCVTGGGGLVGVFKSDIAAATARWQFARTWSTGSAASYANNKDVTPSSFLSTDGGPAFTELSRPSTNSASVSRLEFGYSRLHEKL